jgi:hypothetical protein
MSDDELVRRYLLGDLPGDEEEALETRLLFEDDLNELAEAVEAEILEDFSCGELTPAQRDRVARYLGVSEEGRLRLAVVRGVTAIPAPVGRVLPFRPVLPAADKLRALAAMLIMAVGAGIIAGIQVWPPKPAEKTGPESSGPRIVQTTPTPTPAPVLPQPTPLETFAATIVLSSLRSAAAIPSYDIAATTDIVALNLVLPAGDEGYPSYRVVLNDDADQEVTKSEGLHVSRDRQLALKIAADQLPSCRYTLTVQGVTPEGEVEDLAFPEFEVQEP